MFEKERIDKKQISELLYMNMTKKEEEALLNGWKQIFAFEYSKEGPLLTSKGFIYPNFHERIKNSRLPFGKSSLNCYSNINEIKYTKNNDMVNKGAIKQEKSKSNDERAHSLESISEAEAEADADADADERTENRKEASLLKNEENKIIISDNKEEGEEEACHQNQRDIIKASMNMKDV